MFTLSNVMVVPTGGIVNGVSTVGSNVMVKDPITGSTGAPRPKPLAVKLMISVIVVAFAGPAPRASMWVPIEGSKRARRREIRLAEIEHVGLGLIPRAIQPARCALGFE